MKPRSTQFDVRENTASSRRHAPRLPVNPLPSMSETLPRALRHRQPTPVLPSRASEPGESVTTTPLGAATGGEKGDTVETLSAPATVIAANKSRQVFEPLIGCEDAAKLLGNIHVKTLQRYARGGTLPGYRVAGHWYFRATELDAWLRSRINSSCHPCRLDQEKSDGT
jgi:excisionase family DNA binding protein